MYIQDKKSNNSSILNKYRSEISDLCFEASESNHNLYRLNVPTGSGKTLSSLRFALNQASKYKKNHIFYVAPFNSILEQNADEIRKAVGNPEIVLEHHCNICYEDDDEEKRYSRLIENWDSPIVATSAVQMLNTLFSSQKSSIRRMNSLCNSVIIFDEVQAIPLKCTELFNLAINFLTHFCNTTVVLCSATQPSLAKLDNNQLVDCKEMICDLDKYMLAFKRVEYIAESAINNRTFDLNGITEFILEKFKTYKSILMIVNTKNCARDIYKKLEDIMDGEYLYHLSTNMCPQNRVEVLDEIREKLAGKKPIICISTQLIEAGVDVSFECVIRSEAGVDSIVQAAGRCNRNKELKEGKVYIVRLNAELENLTHLKDIQEQQKATEKVIYILNHNEKYKNETIDSESIVKNYYDTLLKTAYIIPKTEYPSDRIANETLEMLLGSNRNGKQQFWKKHRNQNTETLFIGQAFKTAGDKFEMISEEEKKSVIVAIDNVSREQIEVLKDQYSSFYEKERALKVLQRYSIGISSQMFNTLSDVIYRLSDIDICILNGDYYSKKIGILQNPEANFLDF